METFTSPSARISSEVSRDLSVHATTARRIPDTLNAEQVPLRLTKMSQTQISFPNQQVPATPVTQSTALLCSQFVNQLKHHTTQCPTYYVRTVCKGGRGVVSYILSGRQQHGHHVLVIPCTLHINPPPKPTYSIFQCPLIVGNYVFTARYMAGQGPRQHSG